MEDASFQSAVRTKSEMQMDFVYVLQDTQESMEFVSELAQSTKSELPMEFAFADLDSPESMELACMRPAAALTKLETPTEYVSVSQDTQESTVFVLEPVVQMKSEVQTVSVSAQPVTVE